jgi:DnaJ-class molecular chaperone
MATRFEALRTLGLPSSATADEVKSAFKREARRWHPDTVASGVNPEVAKRNFTAALEAFKTLQNQESRDSQNPVNTSSRPKRKKATVAISENQRPSSFHRPILDTSSEWYQRMRKASELVIGVANTKEVEERIRISEQSFEDILDILGIEQKD